MLRDADRITVAGGTPTQADLDAIAIEMTPPSFNTGNGHISALGYLALDQIIAETYRSRGWTS